MEKWEYKTVNVESKGPGDGTPDINNFTMVINQLGSVGWELVSCFTANQGQGDIPAVFAVLKRKTGSSDSMDQSPNIQGKARVFPEKGPRTYGDKPRTFGKGPGNVDHRDRSPRPGKGSPYSGDNRMSSGYKGKASGYKGKSSGNAGKGSWKKDSGPERNY